MTEKQDPIIKEKNSRNTPQNTGEKPLSRLELKRAQNLRDNLLKRKEQARARAGKEA